MLMVDLLASFLCTFCISNKLCIWCFAFSVLSCLVLSHVSVRMIVFILVVLLILKIIYDHRNSHLVCVVLVHFVLT